MDGGARDADGGPIPTTTEVVKETSCNVAPMKDEPEESVDGGAKDADGGPIPTMTGVVKETSGSVAPMKGKPEATPTGYLET